MDANTLSVSINSPSSSTPKNMGSTAPAAGSSGAALVDAKPAALSRGAMQPSLDSSTDDVSGCALL